MLGVLFQDWVAARDATFDRAQYLLMCRTGGSPVAYRAELPVFLSVLSVCSVVELFILSCDVSEHTPARVRATPLKEGI